MVTHYIHCESELLDNGHASPLRDVSGRDASATVTTASCVIERKEKTFWLLQKPYIEYTNGDTLEEEQADQAAYQRVMQRLQPYFDAGWELDGSLSSAVVSQATIAEPGPKTRTFLEREKIRLDKAVVKLRRHL